MLDSSFLDPGSVTLGFSSLVTSPTEYQRGFHEMVMLFQLMVEHDHETFWLFQFFLQKTVSSNLLLPTAHQAKASTAAAISSNPQRGVGQRGWVVESFEFRAPLLPGAVVAHSAGLSFVRPPRLSLRSCLPLSHFCHMTYSPDTLEDPAVPRVYSTLHPGGGVYHLGRFSLSPSRSFLHPLPLFAPLQKYAC